MKRFRRMSIFAFCLPLALSACTLTPSASSSISSAETLSPYLAYTTLEINPGIGMMINEQERVEYVHALNADGEMVLLQLQLANKTMTTALQEIAQEMVALQFVNADTVDPQGNLDVLGPTETIQNQVRTLAQTRIENAFEGEMIMLQMQTRTYTQAEIDEAEAKGVSPIRLQLVKQAMIGQNDLFEEDALALSPEALLTKAKQGAINMKQIASTFAQEFIEARKLIHDEFLLQIRALEAAIEDAITSSEDTTDLEAQLEALKAAMVAEIQLLVVSFRQQTVTARANWQTMADDRRGGGGNSSQSSQGGSGNGPSSQGS